ncbi:MAG: cupin domain-containing protein, partial [Proteobacteria bacterium]|nr:cupin domain-containing protein [Pseudomonadota bacterium]
MTIGKQIRRGLAPSCLLLAGFCLGADKPNHTHHFSLPGKNDTYVEDGTEATVNLSAAQSEGRVSVQDEYWPPGYKVQRHFHKKHAEIFYIVSGKVEWTVGGEAHVMGAGDMVYIPPNTVHTVKTVGNEEMRTLMIYEPGGYEDYQLNEVGYTKEQLKTPEVKAKLRKLGDFNVV